MHRNEVPDLDHEERERRLREHRLTTAEAWSAAIALVAVGKALDRLLDTHPCEPDEFCPICEGARSAAFLAETVRSIIDCYQLHSPGKLRRGLRLFRALKPETAFRFDMLPRGKKIQAIARRHGMEVAS